MKIRKALLITAFLIVHSCEKPTSPLAPPVETDLRRIIIEQIDYDSLRIRNRDDLVSQQQDFQRIEILGRKGTVYQPIGSVIPSYQQDQSRYKVLFDVRVRIIDSSVYQFPLIIRYVRNNGNITDLDTSAYTLSYPYPSTEVFVTQIQVRSPAGIQDIARLGDKFYYHPLGGYGLYEYDLNSMTVRELINYGGGDHIAADSIFVFADVYHNSVWRYDLSKDSARPIISSGLINIFGMDVYERTLYVLTISTDGLLRLKRYTYDGVLLDSVIYRTWMYYLAIHQGVAYGVWYPDSLSRFDLSTQTRLPNIKAPIRYSDGIKFHGGYLYFCDNDKRLVGRVPVADLPTGE